ncbi:acylphosphatase [Candidatus Woesearchaeota archaeon]|nr:acylphosphatase [Candidatus Woesearchaeota archaeon]
MKRLHLSITGLVQGVFFRKNIVERAEQLGVSGFAKNCADGSVEVVAEGAADKLEKFAQYCKTGPTLAKVSRVDVVEEEFENEFDSFFMK